MTILQDECSVVFLKHPEHLQIYINIHSHLVIQSELYEIKEGEYFVQQCMGIKGKPNNAYYAFPQAV